MLKQFVSLGVGIQQSPGTAPFVTTQKSGTKTKFTSAFLSFFICCFSVLTEQRMPGLAGKKRQKRKRKTLALRLSNQIFVKYIYHTLSST